MMRLNSHNHNLLTTLCKIEHPLREVVPMVQPMKNRLVEKFAVIEDYTNIIVISLTKLKHKFQNSN